MSRVRGGGHVQWTGKPKRAYATIEEAEPHRQELEANKGREFHIYKCYACKQFHVGTARLPEPKRFEMREMAIEERLVGRLIGIMRKPYLTTKVTDSQPGGEVSSEHSGSQRTSKEATPEEHK